MLAYIQKSLLQTFHYEHTIVRNVYVGVKEHIFEGKKQWLKVMFSNKFHFTINSDSRQARVEREINAFPSPECPRNE